MTQSNSDAEIILKKITPCPTKTALQFTPFLFLTWFINTVKTLHLHDILNYFFDKQKKEHRDLYNKLVLRAPGTPFPAPLDEPTEDVSKLEPGAIAQNKMNKAKWDIMRALLAGFMDTKIDDSLQTVLENAGFPLADMTLIKLFNGLYDTFAPPAFDALDAQILIFRTPSLLNIDTLDKLVKQWREFSRIATLGDRTFTKTHAVAILSAALTDMNLNAEIVLPYQKERLALKDDPNKSAADPEKLVNAIMQYQHLQVYKTPSLIQQSGLPQITSPAILNPLMGISQANIADLITAINHASFTLNAKNVPAPAPAPAANTASKAADKHFCSTHGKQLSHPSTTCRQPGPLHAMTDTFENWTNKPYFTDFILPRIRLRNKR